MANDVEARASLLAPSAQRLASTPVFPLIHQIRFDIQERIDTSFTWDQLNAADINFAIVRPCVAKFAALNNLATIYALFVVRGRFLSRIESDLANAAVWTSRAHCCELVATKVLRRIASRGVYELVAALTTSWNPLAGASDGAVDSVRGILKDDDDMFQPSSALDVAIATKAKHFLASALVQKVIYDIWAGNIEFSAISTRAILADNYKTRQIEYYDCWKGPVLNHYRLRVPKYGTILEFLNFAALFATFLLCMFNQDLDKVTIWEILFCTMAVAFALEEYTAAQEHGLNVFMTNIWNGFDTAIIAIFLFYAGYRIHGVVYHERASSDLAFDILACEALILFPRLAFFAMSDNVVIIALQGMIKEFCFFMFLAAVCFSGLMFTLWKLAAGAWKAFDIAWLMVQIWFGNTYLSFQRAESFHPLFGPILMVLFAALSNTLLITILISILSNTFARIDANATQEYLFQFAVTTMGRVKGDALFWYQPPCNLLAYAILYPAHFVLTPHAFHRLNVFLMRIMSLPILLAITAYERYLARGQKLRKSSHDVGQSIVAALPRALKHSALFEAIVGSQSNDLFEAIFEVDEDLPEPGLEDRNELIDERILLRSFTSRETFHRDSPYASPIDQQQSTPVRKPRRQESRSPSPLKRTMQMPATDDRTRSASRSRALDINTDIPASESSPIARFFARRPVSDVLSEARVDAVSRRLEQVADSIKDLQVHRIKDDMKELQERQARIENLLMMLTRGMRADGTVGPSNSTRR